MQLTRHTDYGLRLLIYLAAADEARPLPEIAEAYGISRNHLVKIAHQLVQLGYLKTVRGRRGGIRLARPPRAYSIGDIVRDLEPGFDIAECFSPERSRCAIARGCHLRFALDHAKRAFLEALDGYTLEDVATQTPNLEYVLGILPASPAPGEGATAPARADNAR